MSMSINRRVKIALLSALALILMFFEVAIPMFPAFLQIDISDMPAVLGAIIFGPMAGVIIELVKNFLHAILFTSTGFVGEFANFIVGVAFVVPVGVLYKKLECKGKIIISVVAGAVSMAIVAAVGNYFFFLPMYAKVFGMNIESFVMMGADKNASIDNIKTLVILAILPFNLIKGVLVSFLTVSIDKSLEVLIRREIKAN